MWVLFHPFFHLLQLLTKTCVAFAHLRCPHSEKSNSTVMCYGYQKCVFVGFLTEKMWVFSLVFVIECEEVGEILGKRSELFYYGVCF